MMQYLEAGRRFPNRDSAKDHMKLFLFSIQVGFIQVSQHMLQVKQQIEFYLSSEV